MNAHGEHGYTLVELLVVILLLGFIALGIGGGIHFGTRVWETSEQRIAASNDREQAQTILRALFASALPRKQAGFVTFEGMRTHLAFDAGGLPALGIAGVAHVDIEIAFFDGHKQLRLRARPRDDRTKTREAILANDIGPVEFAFLDAASAPAVPEWLASWRDRGRLPDAVRLQATAPGGTWPYFVARLPIAQTADCVFDPAATDCGGGG